MISLYTLIAYSVWAIMFIVWIFGRIGNKRTLDRPGFGKFIFTTGLLYFSYFLLFTPFFLGIGRSPAQIYASGLLGDLLCILGVCFAIWARLTLGKNWSGITATQKEGHELITTGPYSFVRHPIYAGFFLGMLGFAMTVGTWLAYSAVLLGLTSLLLRIQIEEKLMRRIFPDSYEEYASRVKRLVPFIW